MSIPLHRRTRCAECGDDLDTATAESCDTCQIWLCAADKLSHDCDGYRSVTPEERRQDRAARQTWLQAEAERGPASEEG